VRVELGVLQNRVNREPEGLASDNDGKYFGLEDVVYFLIQTGRLLSATCSDWSAPLYDGGIPPRNWNKLSTPIGALGGKDMSVLLCYSVGSVMNTLWKADKKCALVGCAPKEPYDGLNLARVVGLRSLR